MISKIAVLKMLLACLLALLLSLIHIWNSVSKAPIYNLSEMYPDGSVVSKEFSDRDLITSQMVMGWVERSVPVINAFHFEPGRNNELEIAKKNIMTRDAWLAFDGYNDSRGNYDVIQNDKLIVSTVLRNRPTLLKYWDKRGFWLFGFNIIITVQNLSGDPESYTAKGEVLVKQVPRYESRDGLMVAEYFISND